MASEPETGLRCAPSAPIRAVVFDLDGLMVNTEDVFSLSGIELLARRGRQMTSEIHHAMLGRRPAEAFDILRQITGITESAEQLMAETRQIFESLQDEHLQIMPGLPELLSEVRTRRLPKAVATSSPADYLSFMLQRFRLDDHFAFHLTAEDVRRGKPDPEIYLRAAELLSVPPESMLVLEDSEAGTRAAAGAGAFVVSVPNEHTRNGDFSTASGVVESLTSPLLYSLLNDHSAGSEFAA